MNSGSCGVRYQMSIAHGHRNTFMPHQSLNAVYIFAITRQPTCEGMPKTMEYNSPCSVIRLDTVIEPNRICKSLKCVRKISTSCTALNRWENHIHRWNYLSSIMTFFKNFQRSIVQWYFAARLAVCFIAHRTSNPRPAIQGVEAPQAAIRYSAREQYSHASPGSAVSWLHLSRLLPRWQSKNAHEHL